MDYLNTNLKIYQFEDGEEWFIAAVNLEDATEFYKSDCVDANDPCYKGYEVVEITKNTDICINAGEDEELINIRKRHLTPQEIKDFEKSGDIESVPIWTYLKYSIIEQELSDGEIELPMLLASSAF